MRTLKDIYYQSNLAHMTESEVPKPKMILTRTLILTHFRLNRLPSPPLHPSARILYKTMYDSYKYTVEPQ